MTLFDAHNHLHDARLAPWRESLLEGCAGAGVGGAVVNGTREEDWEAVADLCRGVSWARPAFGLHPWYAAQRSAEWELKLAAALDAHPEASIGEVGLDRWMEGHDLEDQLTVLQAQLSLARERGLAVTIHCLQAWGALWDVLREGGRLPKGFLIHAYGGPAEMLDGFVERGGYFSFSTSFLHPRKERQRQAFAQIPLDRLLIETDAPGLAPPEGGDAQLLPGEGGEVLNSPLNLKLSFAGLCAVRKETPDELRAQLQENFTRLFLAPA